MNSKNGNSENNARVEAYLDQVLAPLTRRLSQFHREELRRELRAHLWERIDAYCELGQSEDDAVNRRGVWQEILTAARPALRLSLLALSLNATAITLAGFFTFDTALGGPFLDAVFSGLILISLLLSPAALGIAQSRYARHRPGFGMFVALSAEIIGITGLYGLTTAMGLGQTKFGDLFSSLPLIMAAWMPTACASAALSGWWTQRSKPRQLA